MQQIRYFLPHRGFVAAFVPGGRWFLTSANDGAGTLLYYDLDSRTPELEVCVLIDYHQKDLWIGAMDVAIDPTAAQLQFDLALELMPPGGSSASSTKAGKIAIWRVKVDDNDELVAEPMSSWGPYGMPVYTVHRWRGLEDGLVSHSLLLPQAEDVPRKGVRLLPDGRIISIFPDRVELHGPPQESWEEGTPIRRDMVRVPPQWVFKFKEPISRHQHDVSRPIYYPKSNLVVFSLHNGESLFSFRIITDHGSSPEVTEELFGPLEDREHIGLGTSHAIRNTPGKNEAVLMSFRRSPQLSELLLFAGIMDQTSGPELKGHFEVTETLFRSPYPSAGGNWEVEEQSGRVFYAVRGRLAWRDIYAILYF
ncbi:hypothetical protein FRC01_004063 [Tulasnella sp. 417]|nr:hypothetical protein FRC01_004063 [Tulasnella sp. 417]